jgi:uncharacterized repeat protein (TIGR03833 family)
MPDLMFFIPLSPLTTNQELLVFRQIILMEPHGNGQQRSSIRIGFIVDIIRKEDQRSGRKTRGIVQEILTSSLSHPHGIKVRLNGGQVGRVAEVIQGTVSENTNKKVV